MTSLDLATAVIWVGMFLLVSGPVHECAHAFTAWKLGDGTAKLFGRITLDPVKHFDPIGGTLLAGSVVLGLLSGGAIFGFGWAKPTPVNPYNLRGRYADTMVAVAGPLSNLALAAVCAVGFRFMYSSGYIPDNTSAGNMLQLVFYTGVWLNVVLMLFNLIPVPPLDGSHVLFELLDSRTAYELRNFMNQYGLLLLLGVIIVIRQVVSPIATPIVSFLIGVPLQ
ncbi:MAG: site-2 protease family protein [Candidatus Limnocylindrales bacterium]